MNPKDKAKSKFADLQRRAEERVANRGKTAGSRARKDTGRLIHELDVYQVELEIQNEELRHARVELEAAYRDLYDSAPVGYFTLGPYGDIKKTNVTGANMLGWPVAQLLGRRFATFVSPESLPCFDEFFRRVMRGRGGGSCAVTLMKGGNTPVASYINSAGVGLDSNCRLVVVDITSAEAVNLDMRAGAERLKPIRAPSNMGVWEWERNSNDIYWSPECANIFDFDRNCPTVDTLVRLLPPEDAARVAQAVRQVLEDGKMHSVEFRIIRPNGEVTWISASGEANKHDIDGKPLRLAGTVQDVTQHKLADDDASPGPLSKPYS